MKTTREVTSPDAGDEPDYHGEGGSYEIDKTGKRVLIERTRDAATGTDAAPDPQPTDGS